MKVYISSDKDALKLKDALIKELENLSVAYEDLTEDGFDFVDSSNAVCEKL